MSTETLYVVKRTFVDPKAQVEPKFNVAFPATFTKLETAKTQAVRIPLEEGYEKGLFLTFEVNDGTRPWKHGDGVIVYAEGPSGELLKVEIEAIPNNMHLHSNAAGRVRTPLWHVVETIIDYNNDRSGLQRYTSVQGTHATREAAYKQALTVLLPEGEVTKEDFVEYNEYDGSVEGIFGADVVVHAVQEGGQNLLISVVSDG